MWTQLDIGPTVSVSTSIIWILDESGLYEIEMSAEEQKVRRRGRENVWGQKVNEEWGGRAALCWDGHSLQPRHTQSSQLINKAIKQIYQKRIGGNYVSWPAVTPLAGRRPLPAIILAVFISRN